MPATSAARMAGVGVFVIAALLLFTVGLFMIGDRQMAFADRFTIYTEFEKITGLQPGAVVRVSGAKAGSVIAIVPPGGPSGKFRVQIEVTEDLHPLVRTDSVASIETEGLVGGNYLGIATGTDAAPPVPDEGTIAGREPFDISDLMHQMGDTIVKLDSTIDDVKGRVEEAVTSVGETVDNANLLILDVSDDVKTMAAAGARISGDASEIVNGIRRGEGTIGKLVKDDQLYGRITTIAKEAQEIATGAREVVEKAKATLTTLEAKDGPVQGIASSVKQTMDDARLAMAGLAENMDALKRNFLLRGFFNRRGYFELAAISPADYRQGMLTDDGKRQVLRVWLRADMLFEQGGAEVDDERLTEDGKARLGSAIAPYLEHLASGVVMIEGYAQAGTQDVQYLRARARASTARDYLVGRFGLDPQATGAIALGADSTGSPGDAAWDGIAVAVFVPTTAFAQSR